MWGDTQLELINYIKTLFSDENKCPFSHCGVACVI